MIDKDMSHFPLFESLETESLREIQARLYPFSIPAGQVLFFEGERAEFCYFIKRGTLRVLKTNLEGRVQVITRLTETMPINIISLLSRPQLNQATVESITSVDLWVLSSADFEYLINRIPDFSTSLLRSLASRVSQMNVLITELSLYPVSVRLARFIIKIADSKLLSGNWTQEEIAAQIGTTRDMVGRLLRDFSQRGLILKNRSKIILVDRKGLFEAAELPSPE
jgi:CRP-like cAMP-binding protein